MTEVREIAAIDGVPLGEPIRFVVAKEDARVGARVERPADAAEPAGRVLVVGVEETDDLASGGRETDVARDARKPSIVLCNDADTCVLCGKLLEHGERAVGGTVVDGDDLPRRVILF